MKYLSLIIIAFSIFITACNHNNQPPTTVNLPINEQFLPMNVEFNMSDTEYKQQTRPWWDKGVVVNSSEEIPNDPFGFQESYYKINFKNNTLLLYYQIHDYNVVSITNMFYRNTVENTYNWSINLGISGDINEGDKIEKAIISRFAILVPKLPTDANVKFWHGLRDHNWNWDK